MIIPEMNFTCNASIIGFIVAGRELSFTLHSQIQIWQKNSLQNFVYNKVGGISVNMAGYGGVHAAQRTFSNARWCILLDAAQVSVESGDILGLELPDNNCGVYFTKGGPENCVFQNQLGSTVNFSNDSSCMHSQHQLPQISFNFTSGKRFELLFFIILMLSFFHHFILFGTGALH